MAVLECVKPGVRSGQVILAVDLTVAGSTQAILKAIADLGYSPKIRHISYTSGVHVLAILKDEQHESCVNDEYLLDEWTTLIECVPPNAVHLWRGK